MFLYTPGVYLCLGGSELRFDRIDAVAKAADDREQSWADAVAGD